MFREGKRKTHAMVPPQSEPQKTNPVKGMLTDRTFIGQSVCAGSLLGFPHDFLQISKGQSSK